MNSCFQSSHVLVGYQEVCSIEAELPTIRRATQIFMSKPSAKAGPGQFSSYDKDE